MVLVFFTISHHMSAEHLHDTTKAINFVGREAAERANSMHTHRLLTCHNHTGWRVSATQCRGQKG